jgi:DNA polymerase III delta subunit
MDARKRSPKSPTKSSADPSKAGSPAPATRRAAKPALRGPAPTPVGTAELLERFSRGEFPATLYAEGPSEPLKAALLAELRRAWSLAVPESPRARVFRAAEASVEELLAAFLGGSLFSPRDLILVLDVEDMGRSEKKLQALAGGIARPTGASCLVLIESAADTARKSLEPLRSVVRERWTAALPGRRELQAWGARRLAREHLTPEAGVVEQVVDACEGDALAFFNELDKLCVMAGAAGRVTRADVDALLRPVVGADLPEYLGAVALGQQALAARSLGRLLAAGTGEGTVLFALSNLVGGALGGWARHRELSEALRRRRPPESLAAALDVVYRAEAAWKSGRADVIAVLEQATHAVAGER